MGKENLLYLASRVFLLPIAFPLILSAGIASAEVRLCGTRHLAEHPELFPLPRAKPLATRQTPGPVAVGTRLEFLVAGDFFLRPATCRYVGEYCYLFVEDSQWDTYGGSILQSDVDSLAALFERATPIDPERGIYPLEIEAFGQPPDVDGDRRIFILILKLADPRLIGFFDPRVATWPDPALRRDTLYLSADAVRRQRYLARGTLAHVLQHLIHWGQDPDEEAWVDEGLSGYAEALVGVPETDPSMVPEFLAKPDLNLTSWPLEAKAANYGATYLFAAFLAERYGKGMIRQWVAEPRNGIFGLDAAFRKSGWNQDFQGAWEQWIVANCAADELNGYQALKGRRVKTFPAPALPFEAVKGMVNSEWGTVNVLLRQVGNLAVKFTGEETGRYSVWGYAMRGKEGKAVEMALDRAGVGQLEVEGVDSLAVIVGRTSPQGGTFWLSAWTFVPTVVDDEPAELPRQLRLAAAYPNPFNHWVWIPFVLPQGAELELSLWDGLGQQIRVLRQGWHAPGQYQVLWDGQDAAGIQVGSGTYLAVLRVGTQWQVQRLTLIK